MGAEVVIKEFKDGVPDKDPQASSRGQGLVCRTVQGVLFQGPTVSIFQDRGIKSGFIPKVVIYRGEVGPGPTADFPDGGLAVAPGGKDLAGGFQEALPGVGIVCRFPFSICRFQFTVFRY
jgi:hypothetical protein